MIARIMTSALSKKIVSVIVICFVVINITLPSFAQESDPLAGGPTPTVAESPTATPTNEPTPLPTGETTDTTQAQIDESFTYEDTSTESGTIIVSPEGAYATNSGDLVDIDTSSTNTLDTTIENTNNADVDRTIDTTNNTGDNTLTDNIALNGGTNSVITGDAESIQNITTVVNTNVVAQSAAIVLEDVYGDHNGDINLAALAPCYVSGSITTPEVFNVENSGNTVKIVDDQTTDTTLVVRNENNADINNDITLTSNTGDNTAVNNISSGTSVTTGDAYTSLNLFTMANTNLVGNCYFYGVINLFGNQNGDIIFPYELDILNNSLNPLVFKLQSSIVNTGNDTTINQTTNTNTDLVVNSQNTATVTEHVETTANTGDNSLVDTINFSTAGSIATGNATSNKNVLDMLNTNYVASNFFVLLINRYGTWNGQVIGLDASYVLVPKTPNPSTPTLAQSALVNSGDLLDFSTTATNNNTVVVENINNLNVNNNITLSALTGSNEAGRFNASINTGNAHNQANIFTMGNTNITGDSWFFAVVNIFDNFVGNIVFPRPDLAVHKVVDQPHHNAGDNFAYTIYYANQGNTHTDNVTVTDVLPAHVSLIGASAGATIAENVISWNIGRLEPGQSGSVSLVVTTDSSLGATDINNTATITGTRVEATNDNNNSTAVVHIASRSSSTQSTITATTVATAVSAPLAGSILPTAAYTGASADVGVVKGLKQTVAKGKSSISGKSADCGLECQAKALRSDISVLIILAITFLVLVGIRKKYFVQ